MIMYYHDVYNIKIGNIIISTMLRYSDNPEYAPYYTGADAALFVSNFKGLIT